MHSCNGVYDRKNCPVVLASQGVGREAKSKLIYRTPSSKVIELDERIPNMGLESCFAGGDDMVGWGASRKRHLQQIDNRFKASD